MIDIGAHWGVLPAFLDLEGMTPECVVCIEPDPLNYENLEKTCRDIQTFEVKTVNAAIADHSGAVSATRKNGSCLQIYDVEICDLTVPALTLRDALRKAEVPEHAVTHIKIDVDGYEPEVLSQLGQLDLHPEVKVLLEFWPGGLSRQGICPSQWLRDLSLDYTVFEQDVETGDVIPLGGFDLAQRLAAANAHLTNLVIEGRKD